MKEKIDKIFLIIICVGIVMSSVFVGAPVGHNYLILSVVLSLTAFVYLVINSIIEPKRNWTNNAVSIEVLILTISGCIPIIFHKCISLSDSVQSVLIYMSLLSVFFCIKEIKVNNKQKYITFSIMISACILCIIGFDNLTYKAFRRFLEELGNGFFMNYDNRMFANFGYANAFAIYIATAFFLTLNEYKKEEKTGLKLLDTAFMTLFMICILLSYSRGTWICLALVVLINIILTKDKKKILRQIGALILSGLIALVFIKIYNKMYSSSRYLAMYISLTIVLITSTLIQAVILFAKRKIKFKKEINIKIRYIVIACIAGMVILAITFIILLQYTKPLVLFKTLTESNEYLQNINYVSDKDGYYDVEIDLEARSSLKNESAYEIIVREMDKYNGIVEEHSILINNEKGTKEIKFQKQEDTKYLTIDYKSLYKSERRGLTINSLTINGQNIVVDYKYLPTKIIEKIKNTNGNNISTWERAVFFKEGAKIISQNGLLGLGGNAWEYLQYQVQEYNHVAKEVHSYPVEILMEFGIIGLIALLLIVFYIVKSLRNETKRDLSMALLLIFVHSCFDFGMSFYVIQLTFFALLACISDEEKDGKSIGLSKYGILVIILIGLVGNSLYLISDAIYQKSVYRKTDKIEDAKKCIEIYPFNVDARKYIIYNARGELQEKNVLWWINNEPYRDNNWILNVLLESIDSEKYKTDRLQIEYIELIYKMATDSKLETPFNVENEMERYMILSDLTTKLDGEQQAQFKELLRIDKNKLYERIQNKASRLSKDEQERYLGEINSEKNFDYNTNIRQKN